MPDYQEIAMRCGIPGATYSIRFSNGVAMQLLFCHQMYTVQPDLLAWMLQHK